MKVSNKAPAFSAFVVVRLRRRWIQLVVAAVIVSIGLLFFRREQNEPKYAGKPLSEWFRQYYRNIGRSGGQFLEPLPHLEAGDAIKAIGTNALPYLVKEALSEERDTALRTNFFLVLRIIPKSWGFPVFVSREAIHLAAANAICEIKPPAGVILPQLEAALNGTRINPRAMGLYILGGIGGGADEVTPYLVSALRETNQLFVTAAANSSGRLGARARGAVPMLVAKLQDERMSYAEGVEVAKALGCIGADAAPAVPRLKELLTKERSISAWQYYATALCQIDPGQTEALDSLINVLRDKKARPLYWREAIQSLSEIGPDAKAAIPELAGCVAEGDEYVWPAAARALAKIGAPKTMFVPQLEERLKSDSERVRAEAIRVLLEIDPENRALRSSITERMRDTSAYAIKTIEQLERAGTAAKWAVPLLREKLKTNPHYSRKLIVEALRRIEPGIDPKSGEAKTPSRH